jgi:hypothetical protein
MDFPHDTDAEAIPLQTCFSDRELASFSKTLMITVFFVGDRIVSGASRATERRPWARGGGSRHPTPGPVS